MADTDHPDWDAVLDDRLDKGDADEAQAAPAGSPSPSAPPAALPPSSEEQAPSPSTSRMETILMSAGTAAEASTSDMETIVAAPAPAASEPAPPAPAGGEGVSVQEREQLRILTPAEEQQVREYLRQRRKRSGTPGKGLLVFSILLLAAAIYFLQTNPWQLQQQPIGKAPAGRPDPFEPEPPPPKDPLAAEMDELLHDPGIFR